MTAAFSPGDRSGGSRERVSCVPCSRLREHADRAFGGSRLFSHRGTESSENEIGMFIVNCAVQSHEAGSLRLSLIWENTLCPCASVRTTSARRVLPTFFLRATRGLPLARSAPATRLEWAAWRTYSWRRASIGSMRAARMAGYTPKITPTNTEMPNAAKTDQLAMMGFNWEMFAGRLS